LLSAAQYDALIAVWKEKYSYNVGAPSPSITGLRPLFSPPPGPCYPSEHAAVAAASAVVLKAIFPLDAVEIEAKKAEHIDSRVIACVSRRSDCDYGEEIGDAVATEIMGIASSDGASTADTAVTIPTGAGMWYPFASTTGVMPSWGEVEPLKVDSIDPFMPPAPPAFGSARFNKDLAETRKFSDNRTAEQLAIAEYWAGGAGTVTPSGIWNERADRLVSASKMSEVRAARAFAYMNVAMFDAGIVIWKAKYIYFGIRPSQQDSAITTPVGLPNFPAFPSGHSGFSAAAARVLGHLFPWEAGKLADEAEEAGYSRFYGGIHYRFDHEASKEIGRKIGDALIDVAKRDNAGSGL